jgi:indolepyruvate ferredoxin oxidoreductase beta subunit
MQATGAKVDAIPALDLALQAGSVKAVNIVLMGRLSRYFSDIPEESWKAALDAVVPPKFLEMNEKAFALGRAYQA